MVTAIAPFDQMDVKLNLFNLAMFNQAILGTVFGSQSPRVQVPNLLNLYEAGRAQDRRDHHPGVLARPGAAGLRGPGGRDDHPRRRQVRRTELERRRAAAAAQPPRWRLKPSGMTRSSGFSCVDGGVPEPEQRRLDAAAQDVEHVLDAGLPVGGQAPQRGAADHDGLGAERHAP